MRKILASVIWIVLWELIAKLVNSPFFPSFFLVTKNAFQEALWVNVGHSLLRMSAALLMAFPLALGLSMIASHSKALDRFLNPFIAFTFPLPKVAIFPLLLLAFGIDTRSKIALIFIGVFYLMYVQFRLGFLRLLNSSYRDIIHIFPIKRKNYYYHFLIKGTLQEILTGLKLAFNYGLTLVVVSEFSASNNGVGYYIWRSWDQFNILNVFSGVITLCFLGFLFYYSFDYFLERIRSKA